MDSSGDVILDFIRILLIRTRSKHTSIVSQPSEVYICLQQIIRQPTRRSGIHVLPNAYRASWNQHTLILFPVPASVSPDDAMTVTSGPGLTRQRQPPPAALSSPNDDCNGGHLLCVSHDGGKMQYLIHHHRYRDNLFMCGVCTDPAVKKSSTM